MEATWTRPAPASSRQREADRRRGGAAHARVSAAASEQAVGHDQQNQDQRPEDEDVAVAGIFRRQQADEQHLGHAEHVAADHGPGDRADAADHRRDEGLQARQQPHERADLAVFAAPHQSAHGGEAAADGEGEEDHAVDVDPHEPRDIIVLRGGAHGDARLAGPHENDQRDHQHDRHRHDGEVDDPDRQRADLHELIQPGRREEGARLGRDGHHREVFQDDRDGKRGDEAGDLRRARAWA